MLTVMAIIVAALAADTHRGRVCRKVKIFRNSDFSLRKESLKSLKMVSSETLSLFPGKVLQTHIIGKHKNHVATSLVVRFYWPPCQSYSLCCDHSELPLKELSPVE